MRQRASRRSTSRCEHPHAGTGQVVRPPVRVVFRSPTVLARATSATGQQSGHAAQHRRAGTSSTEAPGSALIAARRARRYDGKTKLQSLPAAHGVTGDRATHQANQGQRREDAALQGLCPPSPHVWAVLKLLAGLASWPTPAGRPAPQKHLGRPLLRPCPACSLPA